MTMTFTNTRECSPDNMTLLNRMGDSAPKHLQLTVQLQHPRHSLAACCAANLKSSRFPGTLNGASRCLAKFSDLFPSRSRWELALVRGHAENCPGCGTRGGRPGQMVTSAELPDYQASGNLSRIRLQIKST